MDDEILVPRGWLEGLIERVGVAEKELDSLDDDSVTILSHTSLPGLVGYASSAKRLIKKQHENKPNNNSNMPAFRSGANEG